jgi:rubrerythrin
MVTRDTPRIVLRYFLCSSCGYGVAVRRLPAVCPMCRAASWVELDATPQR